MTSYTFATIHGVLVPEAGNTKRPYLPKGSRTHISVIRPTGGVHASQYAEQEEENENEREYKPQLGTMRRLKPRGMGNNNNDDERDTTENNTNPNKHNNNNNSNTNTNNHRNKHNTLPVALTGLIATDPREGTRLTRHCVVMNYDEKDENKKNEEEEVYWESIPLPSQQRIGCVQLTPESQTAMRLADSQAAVFPNPTLFVADVVGNVYAATLPTASTMITADEAPTKRTRQELKDEDVNEDSFWKLITPSSSSSSSSSLSSLSSTLTSSLTSSNAGGLNPLGFSQSGIQLGARGWCGLLPLLPLHSLVCCREFFFDLRLLDAAAGGVVRQYSTTHPPTGVSTCAGLSHSVVVAEGPLASVYDLRCTGAVLQLARDTKNTPHASPVTGRFTTPTLSVADVCSTGNEYEVVLAVGRSLCVHDVRKWNCLSISTNVLKYEIGSIAPLASGKAVVAAGIDSEVRVIALQKSEHASHMADENHNQVNGSNKKSSASHNNNNNNGNNHNGHSAGEKEEGPSGMSFRNRIDSVVSCGSTWQGGWVTSFDGSCASGISVDNELFLSC